MEQRFVADASHELRTPLTALRGNAAYLERHGADPEALADLRGSAERLSHLLDDLLTLAREDASGAVAETPVDLVDVAREALAQHPGPGTLAGPADGRVLARGDRAALLLAVGNLVGNARRHGPPGGPVTVTVERDGAAAVLHVSDEGEGLRRRTPSARSTASGAGTPRARARARPGDRPRGRRPPRRRGEHGGSPRSRCDSRSQSVLKTGP